MSVEGIDWDELEQNQILSVDSGQSTKDSSQETVAMIAVPVEEWVRMKEQVNEIHAAFASLSKSLKAAADNPMLRAMGRQFGVDIDAIASAE